MRPALRLPGVFLILVGTVWFFQGIGLLPGRFMSGQSEWAVYGGLAILAGVVWIILVVRRKR